ncbi:ubiquitin-related domain-containing protein [Yarrowia lipolytica]|uniref:YALI0D05313p n=2 Tax=Yarrowia lipolytica TaxID=4952 RepID=Q6CA73_YARLI|nr:YALI0D05313p [Yarrowia lipolytica CLIB122]AOW03616.1 hypothetical protein YALI1_D06859g [Yarrowia lipolytica]KAB8284623.1 ubiquitin-related domain-containing protein [Yarrowia lipolytica]KAE8170498.1 ubiquitin-related domain-containing protein [Yarrowia lipolytica]KAJ8054767.1 ubiquitin-related domain-containing protein [Yarrowia lipolytica]QNP97662.1 Hypothetical protein YALI2_D00103g [Yarrowia lipolytica]|eukprot:XP_502439.1 YALI0D05313p [Yarrowia lipolytica CLIB122]
MSVREQLQEMGFPPARIEASIKNTSGSLEDAIGWLESNQIDYDKGVYAADAEEQTVTGGVSVVGDTKAPDASAAPIDVDAQEAAAEAEVEKKPLSKEEKEAKLDELRAKAAIRKAENEKKDAAERKRNDEISKKSQKDNQAIKDEMERKTAIREAQKKRKEAADDIAAKKRIKDLIEADKRARAAEKTGTKPAPAPAPVPASKPAAPRAAPTDSRMQFRVPGQPPIVKTFPVETKLQAVAEALSQDIGVQAGSLVFTTTFPTRKLTNADFGKTLKEADLINAAVIVSF